MAIFIVVRVMDTAYAQLDGAKVQFKLAAGAFVTLQPTSIDGAIGHETRVDALPGTTTSCTVLVTRPGSFPVQQDLLLSTTESPSSLAFDGVQQLNVRNIDRHSRDTGDVSFNVFVVPGELRDATSDVTPVFSQTPPRFPPPQQAQRRPAIVTPILDPRRVQNVLDMDRIILSSAANPGTAQHRPTTAKLAGQLFFVERTTIPKLLGVYVPQGLGFLKQVSTKTKAPIPRAYHLFFHPSIPDHFTEPYPFSYSYIDLAARYLRYDQHWAIGKELMYQHEASQKRCILVFPVGAKGTGFGTLATQRNVLKLLQELNYFIQRMVGVSVPSQPEPVAHLAVSGFSAGIRQVLSTLSQDRVTKFNDEVLREVYSFDGIFVQRGPDGKTEVLDVASTDACCAAMRGWFRGGRDGRAIRVYSQGRIWFDRLKDVFPGATLVQGRDGALEMTSAQNTILFAPSVFWNGLNEPLRSQAVSGNPKELYKSVHQFIPAMLVQHAIKLNNMG
ncbi:MAG: hypothetical protein ABI637_00575 [Gemmatimonadota bacterium]